MSSDLDVSALHSGLIRIEKPEEELIKFKNDRSSNVHYALSKAKGSKWTHGSSISEESHSSLLALLNDGERQLSSWKENPHTQVKDLFQWQAAHIN